MAGSRRHPAIGAAERLRSRLLRAALWCYNAAAFLVLNVVMWRNVLWREHRWTPKPVIR